MKEILQLLAKWAKDWRFWAILGTIILLIILYKNRNKLKTLFQSADIDLEEGESGVTSKSRKTELKAIASGLYEAIYSTETVGYGIREQRFKAADELSDTELKFVSKYYRSSLTKGNKLYKDVDDEVMPTTSIDENLMAHLSKIGQKG